MSRTLVKTFLAAALIASALSIVAFAFAPAPTVAVPVTAQTSIPGGIIPTHVGNVWTYAYNVPAGTLADSIPVQVCATTNASAEPDGYPLAIKFIHQGNGGNLPGVTLPGNVTFNANGCQTANISINASGLSNGVYNKNIQVQSESADPSNTHVNLSDDVIHIKVKVGSETSNAALCYVTDSSGNFLFDCSGNEVTASGSTGGRFAIVVNKKNIEVATNPGQFYYNIVWTNNTGSPQTVGVNFLRGGVVPHGAQAIHGAVFQDPFTGVTPEQFNLVNDGVPSGADDKLDSITVPAGWTLWADYHLEWPGIGSAAPTGAGTSCATANQSFTVTGTISTADSTTVNESCTAGASGYKKQ